MTNIVQKCIAWNKARYDQVFNYELAAKLLIEETKELYAAKDIIDKLDAIGDIVFVSIGVFWKMGLSNSIIEQLYDVNKKGLANFNTDYSVAYCNDVSLYCIDNINPNVPAALPAITLACYSSFVTALCAIDGLGLIHRFYDVVDAICESNNTKEIKGKTPAHIKANVEKGTSYVSPKYALMAIVAEEQAKALSVALGGLNDSKH